MEPFVAVTLPASKPTRIYAIGDIHGRSDLLDRMIVAIAQDMATSPIDEALTVTLGDYVDRGPDSRGVVERLIHNPFATRFVALKGNHEALLEGFLKDPSSGEHWRRLGGLETLHSYGIDVGSLMIGRRYETASGELRAALPATHVAFFNSLRLSLTVGPYFLCHAGVRPGIHLERQSEEDLLWIRNEFLDSKIDFGKIVVHGHTPSVGQELLSNRINVDTGAFMTGLLTCAVLEGSAVRFLSTH